MVMAGRTCSERGRDTQGHAAAKLIQRPGFPTPLREFALVSYQVLYSVSGTVLALGSTAPALRGCTHGSGMDLESNSPAVRSVGEELPGRRILKSSPLESGLSL